LSKVKNLAYTPRFDVLAKKSFPLEELRMQLRLYKSLTKLILLFLSVSLTVEAQDKKSTIIFRNVTLIDMTSEQPKPNMTVVIAGNRISKIGKNLKIPKNAEVIDASGKFLIPGLWDMHVHSISEKGTRVIFFPLEIANGITGVRDMFSDCYPDCSHNNGSTEDGVSLEEVNNWRKAYAAGTLIAPRIIASSPIVDGEKATWKGSLIVKNADEGREAVRYIKKRGNGFIKVYSFLSRESYFAIADEAKKQNLIFAGHIPDSVTAIEASDAGQKSGEHLTGILLASSTDEAHLRSEILASQAGKSKMSNKEIIRQMLATFSETKAAALFSRFVRNGTWMCPTLTVIRSSAFLDDANFTSDVRLKYLPAAMREEWKPANDVRFKRLTAEDFAFRRKRFQKQIEIVGAMHRAGVKIIAGTDTPNPFCFPGFSLHDELALFVQAGMTPFEALQTATRNPAKFMNREMDLGTIEMGKLADLVLLDANPLIDISNTRKINAVVVNGRLLKRRDLDEMLNSVTEKARQ
jgi:imidazolonepropionase-like amidohydrolase